MQATRLNHLNLDTCRLLVAHGAAVNAVDAVGYTPLMWTVIELRNAEKGLADRHALRGHPPRSDSHDCFPGTTGGRSQCQEQGWKDRFVFSEEHKPESSGEWLQEHGAIE